jgi:SAM-dependent methyltransferase
VTAVPYPGLADWHEWHEGYDDPGSELAARLRAVRAHVAAVVDEAPPGPVTIVSICGGEGREVIAALEGHPRRGDVRGRLVELDPNNAASARRSVNVAGLAAFEVVHGDASKTDAYDGLPPADLVVISGLFGHLDDDDQESTIEFLRQLCRPGGSVVWTFTARRLERVPKLRRLFTERGFAELSFVTLPGNDLALTVALSRYRGSRREFPAGRTLFTFGSSRGSRRDGVGTRDDA